MSMIPTQEGSPTTRSRVTVALWVALGVVVFNVVLILAGASDVVPFLALISFPAALFLVGWSITWMTRRQAGRLLAAGAAEPPLLAGRRLWWVRASWLVLFVATAIVYAFALPLVWQEANEIYFPQGFDEMVASGSLGLRVGEQAALGAVGDTPGWYPWLVTVRAAVLFTAALAIAWSVFARRPLRWMAYFVAGIVALLPLGDLDAVRSSGTVLGVVARILSALLMLGGGGFLWVFPDGRFRWTFLRYLVAALAAVAAVYLFARDATWIVAFNATILLITGGIATQVWRYRHVPLSKKRLARLNLVILVAIPVLSLMYPTLYGLFERGTSTAVFVWHQVHLTIYLASPVLFGLWVLYLMRNQGWWDAQRFWRRTTVFGILAPLFVAAYVGVLVAVTAVAQAISGDEGQTVAVLVATAAVAFALRPAQRGIGRWVDQRFFPSRRMADETVARFTDKVRQEADSATVRDALVAVVQEALDPVHAAVWTVVPEVR
jgi:hypothetical protein